VASRQVPVAPDLDRDLALVPSSGDDGAQTTNPEEEPVATIGSPEIVTAPVVGPDQLARTIASRPELQPWRHHLGVRMREMEVIAGRLDAPSYGSLLEVGCGNGFGSAYLADRMERVVATDLPKAQGAAHSVGLGRARRLLALTGADHARLVGCSGERLPFADASFDVALMLFSLEHLHDKAAGLGEVYRVLRPGGTLLAAVPTAAWSVAYPPAFYAELARRVVNRMAERVRPSPSRPTTSTSISTDDDWPDDDWPDDDWPDDDVRVVHDWATFRSTYPQFPLPSPHGEYSSFVRELWSQRVDVWTRLCEESGLAVEEAVPLSVIPFTLFVSLAGRTGASLCERLAGADRRLTATAAGRRLAQSVCLVCRKP